MSARGFMVLTICAAAARLSAQPLGVELRVNTYTSGNQLASDVASAADGGFVVVWTGAGSNDDDGVFGRRFGSGGAPLGGEFRVNTYTTAPQDRARVAGGLSGDFAVVWTRLGQTGKGDIRARRFASSGVPIGAEFSVSASGSEDQTSPVISSDATGNFVVFWENVGGSPDFDAAIVGRRFKSSGEPLGGASRVNTYTTGLQGRPAVASDAIGVNFVVVWEGAGSTEGSGIVARRINFNSFSNPAEFRVNTATSGRQAYPSVAADAAGNFVIVWFSDGAAGGPLGIFGRRFSRAGSPLGPEFRVNTFTTVASRQTSVASDLAGSFVVAWVSEGQDGSGFGVFVRRYDSNGAAIGEEFRVNTAVTDDQDTPSAARAPDGRFVVVWRSRLQDGGERGVFAQRLRDAGSFGDANGDGKVDVSDVLFLINFLFAGGPAPGSV